MISFGVGLGVPAAPAEQAAPPAPSVASTMAVPFGIVVRAPVQEVAPARELAPGRPGPGRAGRGSRDHLAFDDPAGCLPPRPVRPPSPATVRHLPRRGRLARPARPGYRLPAPVSTPAAARVEVLCAAGLLTRRAAASGAAGIRSRPGLAQTAVIAPGPLTPARPIPSGLVPAAPRLLPVAARVLARRGRPPAAAGRLSRPGGPVVPGRLTRPARPAVTGRLARSRMARCGPACCGLACFGLARDRARRVTSRAGRGHRPDVTSRLPGLAGTSVASCAVGGGTMLITPGAVARRAAAAVTTCRLGRGAGPATAR